MNVASVRVAAPAKLNLYLRIIGRRPDGFHELETLFERVDLCDELSFSSNEQGLLLSCDDPQLSCGSDNLVLKAAELLRSTRHVQVGARIELQKRIPVAAGLGGGSSDAAATLLGLNQLWRLALTRPQLAELAAQLGSDVAFFLEPSPFAVGRGRGEQLEPLRDLPARLWHVLVIPPERLSTRAVYEGFAAQPPTEKTGLTASQPSLTMCLHALRNGSLSELAQALVNDLEPEAIRRCPVIHEIRTQLLRSGCAGVLTSGSGSAVFGLCQDAAHAERIAQQLQTFEAQRWLIRVVRTLEPITP